MISPRTSFLVWWGLPILCAGLGALAAAYLGENGAFSSRPPAALLVVCGVYFAAVAALALVFRLRQGQAAYDERQRFDKPVEAAMVAMCAPILLAGLWLFAASFLADFRPSHTVQGKLSSIDRIGAFGRSYAIDLTNTTTPPVLKCRLQRDCGSPVPLPRLQPGAQMAVELLNHRVIGLTADGRQLVDPGPQRTWRLLVGGGALALLIVYAAAFVGASMRLLFGQEEEAEPQTYWNAT
jgi:hypothetical protein